MDFKITLIPNVDLSIWIEVNRRNVVELLSFSERRVIYNKALYHFRQDLTTTYNTNRNIQYSEFQWLITCKNLRPDGLVGSIHYYYLAHLIDHFFKIGPASIRSEVFLPQFFKKYLTSKYKNRFLSKPFYRTRLKNFIREWLHPLKRIKQFKHLFQIKLGKIEKGRVMLQSSSDYSKMRWRGFDVHFKDQHCMLFPKDLFHSVFNHNPSHSIVKLSFYNFIETLFQALWQLPKIHRKLSSHNNSLYKMQLGTQVLSQTLFVVWRQLITEEIIKKYSPSEVIAVQTFGDPTSRYFTFAADQLGVKTTIFSCRPMITKLRPEDFILPFELSETGFPMYGLGHQIYVFDKFSSTTISEMGYPASRINFYEATSMNCSKEEKLEQGFLFLMTHEFVNLKFFKFIEDIIGKGTNLKIYIKNHPLARYSAREKKCFNRIRRYNVEDITNKQLHELDLSEVIAVTSFSTSGIEAAAQGAGLVWVSFLTERSIQFAEVMDVIGSVANNEDTFYHIVEKLQTKKEFRDHIIQTQNEYEQNFTI